MSSGTVVVLPTSDARSSHLRGQLLKANFAVQSVNATPGPDATEAARICAAITAAPPTEPMTVVAFGASARLLPSIALAQRAAHRRVREYVLVDPDTPPVTDGWPDAHVTVFSDGEQAQPRLRGWSVEPLSALTGWQPAED